MAAKRKSVGERDESAIYQLKITLLKTDPPVWRRLLVPAKTSLGELNCILQVAMGWTNSHLHQFKFKNARYSDPLFQLDDFGERVVDEFAVTLGEAAPRARARFVYEYDFGDGWEHQVVVEKIVEAEPGKRYPACLQGKRACPPEDCGGVWGYVDFLEAIRNPDHEQHDELLGWVGGEFDPDDFDIEELNRRLPKDAKLFASLREHYA